LLPLFILSSNNDYGEEHHTSHISEHEIINILIVILSRDISTEYYNHIKQDEIDTTVEVFLAE